MARNMNSPLRRPTVAGLLVGVLLGKAAAPALFRVLPSSWTVFVPGTALQTSLAPASVHITRRLL